MNIAGTTTTAATTSSAEFIPWSASHWAAILVTVLVAAALSAARHRLRGAPESAQRLDRGFAALAMAAWLATQSAPVLLEGFNPATALPLHVSDLTALAVPLALWTGRRWLRAMVYYWGVALGSLAFLMPDLRDGPARPGYWLFWNAHVIIASAVIYEIIGRSFKPTWRDFSVAACVSLAYAALMVPFNTITGFGYGYLGPPRDGEPAALRFFGPWPLRVVALVTCGMAAMALLTAPWEASRRLRGHPTGN